MSDPSLSPPSQPGGLPTAQCAAPGCDSDPLPSGFCAPHQSALPGGWVMKLEQHPGDDVWRQRALDRIRLQAPRLTPSGRAHRGARP